MTPLAEFESLLARKSALMPEASAEAVALQAEYEADILARYRVAKPKSKVRDLFKMRTALGLTGTGGDSVLTPYIVRQDESARLRHEAEGRLEEQLCALARSLTPEPTEEMHQYCFSSSGSYRSQGYGANSYARKTADSRASEAIRHGLRAEVRTLRSERFGSELWEDYGVFVGTTPTGWEIVVRRPLPLREWLADCWKRGVNPRVLNPFLPHGLEERLGVSFFGDLTEPQKGVAI